MLCLHHNDADGLCAGAIVRRRFGEQIQLCEVDYGLPIPWDKIETSQTVIITDFSLSKADMLKIYQSKGENFIWIDHHISALKEMANIPDLSGLRNIDSAACVLTWQYFFPDQPVPISVQLIGDRDIWRFEYPQTKAFCEALFFADTEANNDLLWQPLLDDDEGVIKNLINKGQILLDARLKEITRRVKTRAFEAKFATYNTLAINLPSNGDIGHHICSLGYDLAYVYVDIFSNNQIITKVTLYSETIDVSKIAQMYGGGGHKGAAGFQFIRTTNLPFPNSNPSVSHLAQNHL